MDQQDKKLSGEEVVALISAWLTNPRPPVPPQEASAELHDLLEYLAQLRKVMMAFSTGNIDEAVELRGYVGGALKALQGNLRHLAWQANMVAKGDLRQRVSFMGEFSTAFNEMVAQLEHNMQEIASSRDKLAQLNDALLRRIKRQEIDEDNLRRSELHFRHLAITDQLTKTLTRHQFFIMAGVEIINSMREGSELCVLMIDADYFKSVNDTYGHLVGDQVLRGLADRFKKVLRERDMLARYGGEEFVIMLPNASRASGFNVAERLRQSVAAKPLDTDGGPVPITISIGETYFSADSDVEYDTENAEGLLLSLINQADIALYRAKTSGRNQVVFGGPEDGDYSALVAAPSAANSN